MADPDPIALPSDPKKRMLLRHKRSRWPAALATQYKDAEYEILPAQSLDDYVHRSIKASEPSSFWPDQPLKDDDPNLLEDQRKGKSRYNFLKAQSTAESNRYKALSPGELRSEGFMPGATSGTETSSLPWANWNTAAQPINQVRWKFNRPDRVAQFLTELPPYRQYPRMPPEINYFGGGEEGDTVPHEYRHFMDRAGGGRGRTSPYGAFPGMTQSLLPSKPDPGPTTITMGPRRADHHQTSDFNRLDPSIQADREFASRQGKTIDQVNADRLVRLKAKTNWEANRGEFSAVATADKLQDALSPYVPPKNKHLTGGRDTGVAGLTEQLRHMNAAPFISEAQKRSDQRFKDLLIKEIQHKQRNYGEWLERRNAENQRAAISEKTGETPLMREEDVERIYQMILDNPRYQFREYRDSVSPENQKVLDKQYKQIIRMSENKPRQKPAGMFYAPSEMTA